MKSFNAFWGVKQEQFKFSLAKQSTTPMSDIIFPCVSLAFNCEYLSFYRSDVNMGHEFMKMDLASIIYTMNKSEVDVALIQWCVRKTFHVLRKCVNTVCDGLLDFLWFVS